MVHTAAIKGSGWTVSIGGFRDVTVDDVDDFLSRIREATSLSIFQLFNAKKVAGWRHLFLAAVNAVTAFDAGTAISRNLAIEVLLYASCQNQISQALDIIGISSNTKDVGLLVLAETQEVAERAFDQASKVLGGADDSVLQINPDKYEEIMRVFRISALELEAIGGRRSEALTQLVIERGALLPVSR